MNILFLTTHFNAGGITSYILTLAQECIQRGHRVYVISSGGDMVTRLEKTGAIHVTLPIQTKSALSWKICWAIPKVRRLVQSADIHVLHAHTRVTQTLACWVSWLTAVPYVVTCHGFFRPRWFRRIWPCWGLKTIAVSQPVANHLIRDFHRRVQDVVVIRNGIDLRRVSPLTDEQRMQQQQAAGCAGHKLIGIVARLSDVKGHAILIDAMTQICARIANAKLLIVGQGREYQRLNAQVARLGLRDHVVFYADHHQVHDLFTMFDCFVLPSLQEGLGLSVMEAQAYGLPVIASRVGGIPSLIDHESTGLLVEPRSSHELACAIIRILTDESLARMLGVQARAKAEREYGSDQMAEKILNVYQKVMKP